MRFTTYVTFYPFINYATMPLAFRLRITDIGYLCDDAKKSGVGQPGLSGNVARYEEEQDAGPYDLSPTPAAVCSLVWFAPMVCTGRRVYACVRACLCHT